METIIKPLKEIEVKEARESAAKLFYSWMFRGLENAIEEHEEMRDAFILDWIDIVFNLFKNKKKEQCYVYYNTPKKILEPLQEGCIEMIVIDGREGAKELHKRISSFIERYVKHFSFRAEKEGIASEIYDCVDGKGLNISEDFELIKPNNNNAVLKEDREKDTKEKDKLTLKQQIYLLHLLGVFDISQIDALTAQRKGILFANLLNRSEKNTEDTIRNRFDDSQFSAKDKQQVFKLLEQLGLENFEKL